MGPAAILRHYVAGMPTTPGLVDDAVTMGAWAQRTAGLSGADLEAICREAGMAALRAAFASADPAAPSNACVTAADLEHAISSHSLYH